MPGKSELLTKHLENNEKLLKSANENFTKKWDGKLTEIGRIEDFELLKVIGNGAFGTVFLVGIVYCCSLFF